MGLFLSSTLALVLHSTFCLNPSPSRVRGLGHKYQEWWWGDNLVRSKVVSSSFRSEVVPDEILSQATASWFLSQGFLGLVSASRLWLCGPNLTLPIPTLSKHLPFPCKGLKAFWVHLLASSGEGLVNREWGGPVSLSQVPPTPGSRCCLGTRFLGTSKGG